MRALLFLTTLSAVTRTAVAHTLDGDASLVEEIAHQLAGGHHLPLLLIAVVALVAIARRRSRNDRR